MTPAPIPSRATTLDLFRPNLGALFKPGYKGVDLRRDIFGGVTTAIVALPLALAFGVASGVGPIAGLYGAIAAGFFASFFGGTSAQISGPTGPMTVVMGAIVATHATNLTEAFTIVMLGGLIQICFGMLRLGRYIVFTPYSVVSGFMSGIGVIIIIIQSLPFFGLPTAGDGPFGALRVWAKFDPAMLNGEASAIAALTLAIATFWPSRLHRILPPSLAAVVIGTLSAVLFLPGAPTIGEVPSGLPQLIMPHFPLDAMPQIVSAAFTLALLGSIDSLLTSLVADSITRTTHASDKELVGQGIGNIFAGLIGGLPGAGATMRTVINVRAGGRTPVSGMIHAVLLLALVMGLGSLVEFIPHAVLAGILMKVGSDIIDWNYLKRIRHAPRDKVIIMFITLGLTVFFDLITAVAVGIILASFVTARWLAQEELKGITRAGDEDDIPLLSHEEHLLLSQVSNEVALVEMNGPFSYASARELARMAGGLILEKKIAIYDFTGAGYIDTSAALAIETLIDQTLADDQIVFIAGLKDVARATLEGLGVLEKIPETQRFEIRMDAIIEAVKRVSQ